MPKYSNVEVQLIGVDSNAFSIMGQVSSALRQAGVSAQEVNKYRKESMKGNYEELLQTAMRWVTVM